MELRKRGRPKKDVSKTHRFEMRMTEEDLRKLFFLARRYNEQSAADFLTKFIRNEYQYVMQELDEKAAREAQEAEPPINLIIG